MTDRRPAVADNEPYAAIVTGAGTGIGREVSYQLAGQGAGLVLVGRRKDMLEATAERCGQLGAETIVVEADVGDTSAAPMIAAAAVDRFGRIDGLVNNAGTASLGPFAEMASEPIETMFRVNVIGPLALVRACLPELAKTSGSVVNVTSGAGVSAAPRAVGYGASKAALIHATRSLAKEFGGSIRVNAIVPGPCRTEIWEGTGLSPEQIDARLTELGATIPAGRVGEPDEVARWVCQLLDRRSSWVTGSIVAVDGGLTT